MEQHFVITADANTYKKKMVQQVGVARKREPKSDGNNAKNKIYAHTTFVYTLYPLLP